MATPTADTRSHASPPKAGGMPPISLASLARAIRRYSVLVTGFVLLAAIVGGLTYYFLPLPKMTASTVYHIAATPPSVLGVSPDAKIDFQVYKQQQMAIVKSRNVINQALASPGVSELAMLHPDLTRGDPVTYLANLLDISFPTGPEYMRVSLEGNDSEQMLKILKAIDIAYTKLAIDRDSNRRLERLAKLRTLADEYTEENRKISASMKSIAKTVGNSDPLALSFREIASDKQLAELQASQAKVLGIYREREVESQMLATRDGTKQSIPPAELDRLVQETPKHRELVQQIEAATAGIKDLSENLLPGVVSPGLSKLQVEKARLDEQLKKLPEELKPQLIEEFNRRHTLNEQRILKENADQMAYLSNYNKALVRDIDKNIAERQQRNESTFELEALRDRLLKTELIAGRVTLEIEELKPELDAPARVTPWEDPVAVLGIEGNRRAKYTGLATGAVLLLGLAMVQWLDLRNRRVHTVDEVMAGTGLTVLGSMPRYPKNAAHEESGTWNHLLAEAVNTTRTMIMAPRGLPGAAAPPVARTILVTSAASGEGKTSLTTHLAVSLANAGRRVLLIDADMRRPAAHVVLDVPLVPGLSEYLTKGVPAADASQPCQIPGLTVIAAGKWNEASASALTGIRWRDLITHAADEYDFVLIDSPPILPVADALSIARHVDGVLISVMQDQSRYLAVQAACNRLSLVGARMLGVVMAGATVNSGHYYYDRYYSNYKPEVATAE